MKLSVIIPCYNGEATLRDTLEALANQAWDKPWEVLFSNNRSTDRSLEIAMSYKDRLPNFRVVDASDRQGQPHALNTGARVAKGESIAFTDADDAVAEGWVAAMGNALEAHEFVACRTDARRFNGPGRRLSCQNSEIQQLWYPPFVQHAGGGTIGLRKALFEKIGDFDHALPYLHDTDFCIRAQQLGAQIHFVHDAVLELRNRSTFHGIYKQSMNFAEYNAILAKKYWRPADKSGPFWRVFVREWFRLVKRSGDLGHPERRFIFAWNLGRQVGRVKGIVKHHGVPV